MMDRNEAHDRRQAFAWWLWNNISLQGPMWHWVCDHLDGDTATLEFLQEKYCPDLVKKL